MRLRKIKLAGFKSFVDPITIDFPGDLVGVVGPNGCGKSNIIDAVRWVMGEISAKHLRGDSMADVVFSGSNARKPLGQASVELIFDNSDGGLGGRFAGYAEISIKRQVTRDAAQSIYFLNGTRCRRRDVTDVFIGTGLGPRSYAIIEQGMISRIIEAKPDELREFLEEAAGISKYKERRRETESRMARAQENLDRVDDIREELEKRLQHLERQAEMAEKFKLLKLEERALKAERLGLRWGALDAEARGAEEQVARQHNVLESALADQRRLESTLERERAAHTHAVDRFNESYHRVLDASAELARIEESIAHLRTRRADLGRELEQERSELDEASAHAESDAREMDVLSRSIAEQQRELDRLRETEGQVRSELGETERAMLALQDTCEALDRERAEPSETVHAERVRITHLEEQIESVRCRVQKLERELHGLDSSGLDDVLARLGNELKDEQDRLRELEAGLEDHQARIPGLREESRRISAALSESRESHQEARGRLASLQAAQEEALGQGTGAVAAWLGERDLGAALRLAERLDVQHGWERAVETVLGAHLESVCVDDIGAHAREVVDLEEGALGFVDVEPVIDSAPGHAAMAGRLLDKISTPGAVAALMNGVYAVDDVSDALALRARLGPGESAVTRAGVWVGPNWLRFAATPVDGAGVLSRELEIKRLAVLVDDTRARVERDSARLDAGMRELRTCEEAAAEQGRHVGEQHRRVAALRASLGAKQAELDQARSRAAEIGRDLEELGGRSHEDHSALDAARQHLRDAFARLSEIDAQRDALDAERQARQAGLDSVKERWQCVRDEHYEAGLRVESMGSRLSSLRAAGERGQERLARISSRCSALEQALQASQAPLREAKATLEEKLRLRRELERAQESSRTDVESAQAALRESERNRGLMETRVATERAGLEELRMHTREVVIRRSTVVEQIAESGSTLEQALMSLPDEATEQDWQERLERMERRIARLGPINLAAIDEFGQQAERKTYLDAQHADLVEALETLGQAIRKIDRETRARFKDTYEKVNAGLSDMFPRLFGGGTAFLQMTGEDLLSTGITFLARPPGKRNTSIHLLSGGEKALCAIALVFSIFGLNPAPFCLMDEVDAPLDDANVARFCDLVKSMTDRVQFMLVTHNKSTMEITEHLIGVTMNEPGISRLVAVDVEQAVELAAV